MTKCQFLELELKGFISNTNCYNIFLKTAKCTLTGFSANNIWMIYYYPELKIFRIKISRRPKYIKLAFHSKEGRCAFAAIKLFKAKTVFQMLYDTQYAPMII